jgi:hypothetical protein
MPVLLSALQIRLLSKKKVPLLLACIVSEVVIQYDVGLQSVNKQWCCVARQLVANDII